MSEHSPTPWWLDVTTNGDRAEICYGEYHEHEDGWVDSPRVLAIKVLPTLADAEHIVRCVNLHDELVAELELWLPTIIARRKWKFPEDDPEKDEDIQHLRALLAKAKCEG